MKKQNPKKAGENVGKNVPKSHKSKEKNSFSLSSNDKISSSSYNPISKASENFNKNKNSINITNEKEIPLKKLGNIIKKKINAKKKNEDNIIINKNTIFLLYRDIKDMKAEQIKTTQAIEKNAKAIEKNAKAIEKNTQVIANNTKAINEVKNEQKKTNLLLSELIDFFKSGKGQNKDEDDKKLTKKKDYKINDDEKNIINQNERIPQSKESENVWV